MNVDIDRVRDLVRKIEHHQVLEYNDQRWLAVTLRDALNAYGELDRKYRLLNSKMDHQILITKDTQRRAEMLADRFSKALKRLQMAASVIEAARKLKTFRGRAEFQSKLAAYDRENR